MTDDAMWVPPRAVFGLFSYNELVMLGATREACERVRDECVMRFAEVRAELVAKGRRYPDDFTASDFAERYTIEELEVRR